MGNGAAVGGPQALKGVLDVRITPYPWEIGAAEALTSDRVLVGDNLG